MAGASGGDAFLANLGPFILTLSGPAFSVVHQAWGEGGGGAQQPGSQKSRLTSTD